MATPSYARSLACAAKRLRISPPTTSQHPRTQTRHLRQQSSAKATPAVPSNITDELSSLRLPRAVQATYLAPLKRSPPRPSHLRTPTCDLHLRSYSVRNLEVFTDFALRAAYFLHLPASGPIPLPRITERWTVPRSNFIFKKSQENFERRTMRRLIQIQDGDADTVGVWLSFLQKYRYFGVGMKANVFEHGHVHVAADLDAEAERIKGRLGEMVELVGTKESSAKDVEGLEKMLMREPFKGQWGAYAAMSGNDTVPVASKRIISETVGGGEQS